MVAWLSTEPLPLCLALSASHSICVIKGRALLGSIQYLSMVVSSNLTHKVGIFNII